jgi:hypothetical protein
MTIKIISKSQVVCDCTGNTPETYNDKFLLGVTEEQDTIVIQIYCSKCNASAKYTVSAKLLLVSEQ